jgi:hypothetical protein
MLASSTKPTQEEDQNNQEERATQKESRQKKEENKTKGKYVCEIAEKTYTITHCRTHKNGCNHNLMSITHKVSDHHLHHK